MYVMKKLTKGDEYLHLIEFSYNDSYNESFGISLFEVIYGRKSRAPTNWNNPKGKLILGLEMPTIMEHAIMKAC